MANRSGSGGLLRRRGIGNRCEYRLLGFAGFLLLGGIWLVSAYLSALKSYGSITRGFGLGMCVGAALALLLGHACGTTGMLAGFTTGLALLLYKFVAPVLAEYRMPSLRPFAFLGVMLRCRMRANEHWVGTHHANQTATIQVFDAACHNGRVLVVYASSAAIYGDQGDGAIREDAAPHPLTAYGADKLGSELHAAVGFGVHDVPSCGMRFFNVYGPRQDPSSPYSGVISIFCSRLGAGAAVTLHGDGKQTRDFVYVGDLVCALMLGMERTQHGASVYNVCTGQPTTIRQLARSIASLLGITLLLGEGAARPGDIRHSVGDPGKAWLELAFRAETPLIVGLGRTLYASPAGLDAGPARLRRCVGRSLGEAAARFQRIGGIAQQRIARRIRGCCRRSVRTVLLRRVCCSGG